MIKKIRKIIHIDMDAFYAAVEQRDNPELRGKAVIVGGDPEKRGVVSTCSYEARKFGVHSALPGKTAKRLCPHAVFLPVNMKKYKAVSQQIRQIFSEFTDKIEPLSLDEAFLDVTENKFKCPSATILALKIKERISQVTGLTASAGVSFNKFLAKVASDMNKPDGLTVITPAEAEAFLEDLPIEKFFGIGKVTAARLKSMGISRGRDLKHFELGDLIERFGSKSGEYYYNIVRGHDEREVESEWERKSLGRETTFQEDISDLRQIHKVIYELSEEVSGLLKRYGLQGRTVTVKVRYEDFKTVTRSQSFSNPINELEFIFSTSLELLSKTEAGKRKVRLLGVTLSNFPPDSERSGPVQLEFPF
ncbi:DNA polymerase IV [Lentisphaerota bacterium ZTH]|nr:DNA polymerase IV [Lentisphaerota bacterium]WET06310.1 DNA polymerase IV [Lentisphaerota bacterium ZTH]